MSSTSNSVEFDGAKINILLKSVHTGFRPAAPFVVKAQGFVPVSRGPGSGSHAFHASDEASNRQKLIANNWGHLARSKLSDYRRINLR